MIDELGGMDIYFHSSGIGWQNNLLDEKKEIDTVSTNGLGFVRMVDAAFNWFTARAEQCTRKVETSFRIACITSIAGTKGLGAAPAYSATKRMQNHYLECLSQLARMRRLPIRTKVAQLNGGAWFDVPSFKGESSPVYALNQMTLEVKVRPSRLSSSLSESSINPILGSHESLLLRFGDGSNIPANKLNFAKVSIGTNYHPDNKPHYESTFEQTFENDNWYHIAVVYDGSKVRFYLNGELQIEKNTTGGQINLAMSYGGHGWDDTFAIGRSYGSHWTYKGCLSECRVWNVARSQAQIASGVCYVDPTSEGLLAYWRFDGQLQNDGTVLDETGHGHNAVPSGNINWLENQRCPF